MESYGTIIMKDIQTIEQSNELAIFKRKLDLIDLENAFSQLPQVETELKHNFSHGIYVRELFIPKDTIIIGKRHRYETCNIVLKGEISIYMGEDIPVKRLKAPCIFNSEPGVKKMGYTHEDTIFVNIHPTHERNVEKIEDEFIISEAEFMALEGGQQCLGAQ